MYICICVHIYMCMSAHMCNLHENNSISGLGLRCLARLSVLLSLVLDCHEGQLLLSLMSGEHILVAETGGARKPGRVPG